VAPPQYYPLVFTSFWIEWHLWGTKATGFHVVNVLLHAATSILLWRVLKLLGISGAWLAALVFALHPVHVESVAWVTERKNVLSGLFYMASGWCLLLYFCVDQHVSRKPVLVGGFARCQGNNSVLRWLLYGGGLLLFTCALLSKTVTCSLPVAVLLILWWKNGRLNLREVAF